jgi:hypothetical protein
MNKRKNKKKELRPDSREFFFISFFFHSKEEGGEGSRAMQRSDHIFLSVLSVFFFLVSYLSLSLACLLAIYRKFVSSFFDFDGCHHSSSASRPSVIKPRNMRDLLLDIFCCRYKYANHRLLLLLLFVFFSFFIFFLFCFSFVNTREEPRVCFFLCVYVCLETTSNR